MTAAIRNIGGRTFAALGVPNYRLFLGGQAVSLIGTWMQMTAMSWLVLTLTHSATKLGVIVALQTLPVLVLSPYGGVIADRVDKRRFMVLLQSLMGVQALILGLLTVTGIVRFWEIGALAVMLGINTAFENPARQSFMLEMVGPEHLRNAVSLNSTTVSLARIAGPAVSGLMIAVVGTGVCFLLNAASFIAVITSLVRLNRGELHTVDPVPVERGQLRAGLRYVRARPELLMPLAMMAVIGCLAYEFQVSLPYMASNGLHVGASGYGFMMAAMSVGAVIGGLVVATRGRTGTWPMVFAAAGGAVTMALAALAPNLPIELLVLAFLGAANISFMSIGNATLQLRAAPHMRGRVMSLWYVAFQGSTPIGGPIVGAVMSGYGARAGLGLGAAALVAVAVVAALVMRARGIAPGRIAPPTLGAAPAASKVAPSVAGSAPGAPEAAPGEKLTGTVSA